MSERHIYLIDAQENGDEDLANINPNARLSKFYDHVWEGLFIRQTGSTEDVAIVLRVVAAIMAKTALDLGGEAKCSEVVNSYREILVDNLDQENIDYMDNILTDLEAKLGWVMYLTMTQFRGAISYGDEDEFQEAIAHLATYKSYFMHLSPNSLIAINDLGLRLRVLEAID